MLAIKAFNPANPINPTRTPSLLFFAITGVFAVAYPCDVAAQSANDSIRDEVSYTNDIKPIVNNFCTTCHAGENPEGDFVLTSYDDVRKHVEKGTLLKRINDADDPMPQNGLMSPYMRRMFKNWADQGFVNVGQAGSGKERMQMQSFEPKPITPVDVNVDGFELLENMQGHWVGSMNLMGQDFDWWAFDFRPIAPSHVHGIFEGGTIGNLFTSFFVTELAGKRTIMARNGGILNGIYRTSYFVLEAVKRGRGWTYYRLVDAYGGSDIMYMELTFQGQRIDFKAYTSRFGLTEPQLHMSFEGKRRHHELAAAAAKAVGFPKNVIDFEFPRTLPKPTWADEYPMTSASYISESSGKGIIELGKLSKDPRRIDQMPHLSKLSLVVDRGPAIRGKKLLVYLSRDALVDEGGKFIKRYGYIREELLDTLLLFPELSDSATEFTFTYLHPGSYRIAVIADMDGDGFPSPGDITHPLRSVVVDPESIQTVRVAGIAVQN